MGRISLAKVVSSAVEHVALHTIEEDAKILIDTKYNPGEAETYYNIRVGSHPLSLDFQVMQIRDQDGSTSKTIVYEWHGGQKVRVYESFNVNDLDKFTVDRYLYQDPGGDWESSLRDEANKIRRKGEKAEQQSD